MKTKHTFGISIIAHLLFAAVAVALASTQKPPVDEEITLDLTMSSEPAQNMPVTHSQPSTAKPMASATMVTAQATPVLTQENTLQEQPLPEPAAGEPAPQPQIPVSTAPAPVILAKAEVHIVQKLPEPTPAPLAKDAEDEYLENHLGAVRDVLMKYRKYPTLAIRMKQEGVVKVSFRLKSNGEVEDIRIVSGSGYEILDENARELIEKTAQYFPKPPKNVRITVPLSYGLKTK